MSKRSLKRILSAVAPKTFDVIQAIRARRHSLSLQRQWGLDRLEAEFFAKFEPVVCRGPFHGMRLSRRKTTGALIARALGSYERELHPALETIISRGYAVVADVGAAEGYFAVGL